MIEVTIREYDIEEGRTYQQLHIIQVYVEAPPELEALLNKIRGDMSSIPVQKVVKPTDPAGC